MDTEEAGRRSEAVEVNSQGMGSKMKASTRNELPSSKFGLPGSRKYPVNDKAHAANAKARATQQVEKGNLSPEAAAKIRAKANKVLGK
jgi:hypothetical protein